MIVNTPNMYRRNIEKIALNDFGRLDKVINLFFTVKSPGICGTFLALFMGLRPESEIALYFAEFRCL